MFFIQKGLVEVCVCVHVCVLCVCACMCACVCVYHILHFWQILDGTTRVDTLSDGNVFGEVNLVYSEVHSATVCAVTHCDILTLSRADLIQVSSAYPAGELLLSSVCLRWLQFE